MSHSTELLNVTSPHKPPLTHHSCKAISSKPHHHFQYLNHKKNMNTANSLQQLTFLQRSFLVNSVHIWANCSYINATGSTCIDKTNEVWWNWWQTAKYCMYSTLCPQSH